MISRLGSEVNTPLYGKANLHPLAFYTIEFTSPCTATYYFRRTLSVADNENQRRINLRLARLLNTTHEGQPQKEDSHCGESSPVHGLMTPPARFESSSTVENRL